MIPEPVGPYGLLPAGCHRATLDEIADVFVKRAPFAGERDRLWSTFLTYLDGVWAHLPSARLWIDGGFVTHKVWAAPHDVDVCLVVRSSEIDAVPDAVLDGMLTKFSSSGGRIQPMAGAVDAFVAMRGSAEDQQYFRNQWSRVKGPDQSEVPGTEKGYVEVLAP